MSNEKPSNPANTQTHKMPDDSTFYDKVIPALFIGLTVIMTLLILFAIGVLTGLVPWV